MKRLILVVAVILALGLSFVAGLATAIRVERAAPAPSGDVTPQIPWNGCSGCETRWPEWLCWLSGC